MQGAVAESTQRIFKPLFFLPSGLAEHRSHFEIKRVALSSCICWPQAQ